MKKIIQLSLVLLFLGAQSTFAGSTEMTKAKFQFTALEAAQNSWDYAMLVYNINDITSGEALEIPSFLINYEIKDKNAKIVSSGTGLYINVNDAKLGSEEEYTITVYTMINGEKVSHSMCRKASPKKLAMKLDSKSGNTSLGSLADCQFSYSFSRPKFSDRSQMENITVDASAVTANIILDNCVNCESYKIAGIANHSKLTDQPGFVNFEKNMKAMTKEGKNVHLTVSPSLTFRGEVYKTQTSYEVTATAISEDNAQLPTASK